MALADRLRVLVNTWRWRSEPNPRPGSRIGQPCQLCGRRCHATYQHGMCGCGDCQGAGLAGNFAEWQKGIAKEHEDVRRGRGIY